MAWVRRALFDFYEATELSCSTVVFTYTMNHSRFPFPLEQLSMKLWLASAALMAASSFAHASGAAITVYQDPNCGCCNGWVEHMRESGFDVTAIKTADM